MRALPASLRREISALSFLYHWTLPDCVLPAADTGYEGFDVELARLRRLRTDVVAFDLLRPIYDHGGRPRPARRRILSSPEVRTRAVKSAATLGAQQGRAATMLFDDPEAFVERFASLLEAYWEAAFEAEWQRIEPKLAESVERSGRQIADDGLYAFLLSLAPQLRVDPGGRSFGLDIPHDHRVPIGPQNPLLLVPSVYVWPHVRVNCDPPWPLTVVYRAPYLTDRRRATPPQLVQLLKALADPTRLRILELVGRAAAEHAGARAARWPDRGRRVEAAATARRRGPPDDEARGPLRRLLARPGEAVDALGGAGLPRCRRVDPLARAGRPEAARRRRSVSRPWGACSCRGSSACRRRGRSSAPTWRTPASSSGSGGRPRRGRSRRP